MNSDHRILHHALRRLLKPLIRMLLRYGYSFREFNSVSKQLFVEVGYQDFAIEGRKMTASRVSVLTGIDRKEIVKLASGEPVSVEGINQPINRASRVIGGWLQDKAYHDNKGNLIIIPVKGDGISFQSLVGKYGGDITYGPILDELLRINAVQYVDETHLELLAEGYLPLSDELAKLNIMGDSTRDLLNTINYNLDSPKYPRFQREVVYLELSQSSIDEFKLISHDKSQKLLLELNEWLANKLELDSRLEVTQATSRVGVGIYYIEGGPEKNADSIQSSPGSE